MKNERKVIISLLQRKKFNRQDHFVCLLCSEAAAAAASGRYLALHVVKQNRKSVRETVSAKRCNFIFVHIQQKNIDRQTCTQTILTSEENCETFSSLCLKNRTKNFLRLKPSCRVSL